VKITDTSFHIPVVHATEADLVLASGRTRPMLVSGISEQTGERGEYVVKLRGSTQISPTAPVRELVASLICAEIELPVPPLALIHVSQEFAETMVGHSNHEIVRNSLGLNFGTLYMTDYFEVIQGQYIPQAMKQQLYELFALDIFIGNVDRRLDKPNFLTNGKNLLYFDHELSFSFLDLFSFARNVNPWTILESDMEWIRRNFCFNYLRGTDYNFGNFVAKLSALDAPFWRLIKEAIPLEWPSDIVSTIEDYLTQIVLHRNEFGTELNRVLR
jgi:hypothetical protein